MAMAALLAAVASSPAAADHDRIHGYVCAGRSSSLARGGMDQSEMNEYICYCIVSSERKKTGGLLHGRKPRAILGLPLFLS